MEEHGLCPECGRDLYTQGGNPDCEVCAAEPAPDDRLLLTFVESIEEDIAVGIEIERSLRVLGAADKAALVYLNVTTLENMAEALRDIIRG